MARIRTIKPEFFTSDDIVSMSSYARLLFIALWCEADKEGRMEWKPRTFKLRYLPGDDVDIDLMCDEIVKQGIVVLYGNGLAYIPSFSAHQHINPRESASKLPDPQEIDACRRVSTRDNLNLHAQVGREGKGREGKELTPIVASIAADQQLSLAKPDCPHQEIIALYHEVLPQCPQIRDWTPARAVQLRARWNEDPKRQSLTYWRQFFEYVASCDFLVGRAGKNPFFADLEWMTKSGNFTKIREAKYANKAAS